MRAVRIVSATLFGAVVLATLTGTAQDASRRPAPTTVVAPPDCTSVGCHEDVKHRAVLHGPLNVDACDACHELRDPASHAFGRSRPAAELCLYCHEVDVHPTDRLHAPLLGGDCTACHDPHGGDDRRFLRDVESAETCRVCHRDVAAEGPRVHAPVRDGDCIVCHEPHTSENPHLLAVDGRALCLDCHPAIGLALESRDVVHTPVRGDCLVCHDPHASSSPSLLVDEPAALCTGCHEDVGRQVASVHGRHAAVETERGCLLCHDPHASDHGRLLRAEPAALCLDCHDRPVERAEGGTVADIARILEERIVRHAPVADGDCVSCHLVHGGGHDRLLVREYSSAMYPPAGEEAYGLCFVCHDEQLVEAPRTSALTAFRNGTVNLHHVHVKRDDKSRSCHVCHDPHAANRDHLLRDSVPFGPIGWEIDIQWRATENGGTCAAGCHRSYRYDRLEPVPYPVDPLRGGTPGRPAGGDDAGTRAEEPNDR